MKKYLFFGFIFLLAACAKEGDFETYTLAEENNPIFGVQGNLEGSPFELRAGLDDYFLFSDYRYDSSGIFFFHSKLEAAACNQTEASVVACPESFGIAISDVAARPSTYNFQGLSFLRAGMQLDFWQQSLRPYWKSLKIQSYNGNGQQALSVSSYQSFEENQYEFSSDTDQSTVCLAIENDNCRDTLCNTIDLQASCQAAFEVEQIALTSTTTQLQLSAKEDEDANQQFRWSIQQLTGGNNTIQAVGADAQVQLGSLGRYSVCLQVQQLADSCIQQHCTRISTQNYTCAANFQYEINDILAPINRLTEKVRITWVDEQGLRYSSFLGDQPSWSRFQILETHPYRSAESAATTLRVSALLDVRLYNAFGDYKDFREATLDLAFAYPQ